MPLDKSQSFGSIVKKEIAHGKPQKQAVAIAYRVKGEGSQKKSAAEQRHGGVSITPYKKSAAAHNHGEAEQGTRRPASPPHGAQRSADVQAKTGTEYHPKHGQPGSRNKGLEVNNEEGYGSIQNRRHGIKPAVKMGRGEGRVRLDGSLKPHDLPDGESDLASEMKPK